jgi:hypothetical protein
MVEPYLKRPEVKSNNRMWDEQESDNLDSTVFGASTLTVECKHMIPLLLSVAIYFTNTVV